ncbi:MCP four helix bundle domain-containing protein [Providencia stuartii]|uniref:methyl-accepting chemotaxis protein n=1 Tax=unclassified Providencia TaxID=2633465 RepID=UPI00234A06E7|nr:MULTISPECIES: methyl-accepting chemotaxis protein [unclassified Providencia]ELR5123080.1 MCP four helix bundle domain-containing protein [Providencia stuartii]
MSLKDMKISAQLSIAFAFFILLILVSSAFSFVSLNKANNGIQTIIYKDYPMTVRANQLMDNFYSYIGIQELILLDDRDSDRRRNELKKISSNVAQLLKELDENAMDEPSKEGLIQIRDVRQRFLQSQARLNEFLNNNNRSAAIDEMMNNTSAIQREYRERVQNFIEVQNRRMQAAAGVVESNYNFNKWLLATLVIISIATGCGMGWFIAQSITRPLSQAVGFAQAIASGDLTQHVAARYRDETGILLQALVEMKTRLLEIVREVQHGSESISAAAGQIVAGNQNLAARTEEQATSVEETASSMEQITSTVQNTADHTHQATQLAADTAVAVTKNGRMMNQVTEKMRVIHSSSSQMTDIINLIDSIAFQTNILALNASVEAARAGEHGRGFAVVAGEVRLLAQKSANSANDIRGLIENSLAQTKEGMELVEHVESQINDMVKNVDEIDQRLQEIGQASHEQSSGILQINSAVGQLDATTQQNASLVEESVAAAASLNEQALHLKQLVNYFRIDFANR